MRLRWVVACSFLLALAGCRSREPVDVDANAEETEEQARITTAAEIENQVNAENGGMHVAAAGPEHQTLIFSAPAVDNGAKFASMLTYDDWPLDSARNCAVFQKQGFTKIEMQDETTKKQWDLCQENK
ncbi:MAG TPA: hypothetical protein VGR81_14370 [Candidatus Acidoferrales bacterium]|nr:hypothetical protein [Candidatus Acidoferrales bacterium]